MKRFNRIALSSLSFAVHVMEFFFNVLATKFLKAKENFSPASDGSKTLDMKTAAFVKFGV